MVTRMEGPGGEARVGMLETLRAFAHDELVATGELEAAGAAHTEWCVALAVEAGPATKGPDQRAWLDRLEAELPNLRAALRRMLDGGRHAEALAVACDLERLWFVRGHLAEGRRWIAEALAGVPQEGALAARALALAATLAHYGGELGVAEDEAGRAVAAAAGLGAHPDRAEALAALGLMDRALGRYPDAERRYGEAIAILREADRPARLAETLGRRAILAMLALDFAAAIERGEEAVRVARAAGDIASIAYAGPPVAISLLMTGDDAGAQAVLDEALAATRALGNRRHASRALWALGLVALRRGEPARALIEEACALGGEFGDDVFLTFAIPELARAHIAEGGPEPAVRLLAAASAFRAATGAAPVVWFQEEHERAIETARAALGEDRFAAVWREGEAITPDEAFVSGRDAAGDPGPEQEGDAPEPEELTAREAEVLILVARGLTDAQVAAELVLSRRTVHAHLRAVTASSTSAAGTPPPAGRWSAVSPRPPGRVPTRYRDGLPAKIGTAVRQGCRCPRRGPPYRRPRRTMRREDDMATRNAELVGSIYDALARGDIDGALAALDPDVEWVEPDTPGLPFAGVHRGREGVASGVRHGARDLGRLPRRARGTARRRRVGRCDRPIPRPGGRPAGQRPVCARLARPRRPGRRVPQLHRHRGVRRRAREGDPMIETTTAATTAAPRSSRRGPGPGSSTRRMSRGPGPASRRRSTRRPKGGIPGVARRYGLLIDTLDWRFVNGFAYFAVPPAPEEEVPARFGRPRRRWSASSGAKTWSAGTRGQAGPIRRTSPFRRWTRGRSARTNCSSTLTAAGSISSG